MNLDIALKIILSSSDSQKSLLLFIQSQYLNSLSIYTHVSTFQSITSTANTVAKPKTVSGAGSVIQSIIRLSFSSIIHCSLYVELMNIVLSIFSKSVCGSWPYQCDFISNAGRGVISLNQRFLFKSIHI